MDRIELIKAIDEFQDRLSVSDSAIGLGALNDSKFVVRLRAGRRVWPDTAKRVVAYLEGLAKEQEQLQTICTQDGTWIALDKRSGLAHSGKTAKAAETNLRKKLDEAPQAQGVCG